MRMRRIRRERKRWGWLVGWVVGWLEGQGDRGGNAR